MAAPRVTISISESAPNIANNTTTITAKLNYYGNGESWNANTKCSITINGSTKNFTANISTSTSGVIGSHSVTVKHNDDGRKTISYSGYAAVSDYFGPSRTSGTYTCKTIPRVSDLSLDVSEILADGTAKATATATKKSSSFTDYLSVTLGDYSLDIVSGEAFSIPREWCRAITESVSGIAVVTVTTKSGSTTIGSKSANISVKVPDDIKPTISGIEVSEANTAVTSAFGARYVKNLSKLNIRVNAQGDYGSEISSSEMLIQGVKYLGVAVQTDYITAAGEVAINVLVRDGRGRVATSSKSISLVDYEYPSISRMSYVNCDASGNPNSSGKNIKLSIAGQVFSVAAQNTRSLKIRYKELEGAENAKMVDLPDWTFDKDIILSGTDPTKTYLVIAELTDKIRTTSFTLSTGIPVISRLAGGKGVRLFGEAEQVGFWVGDVDYTITDAEFNELMGLLE